MIKKTTLRKDEKGASLVEYALLVALIAVASIVAIDTLGKGVAAKFTNVGVAIGAAGTNTNTNTTPGS